MNEQSPQASHWFRELGTAQQTLILFTPILLLVVAIVQVVRANTIDQSPWKGGGFGMFASVDSPGNREIRAYLVTPEADIEIPLHFRAIIAERSLFDQISKARVIPTEANLQPIANQLARVSWWMKDYQEKFPETRDLLRELKKLDDGHLVVTLNALRELEDKMREKAAEEGEATEESVESEESADTGETDSESDDSESDVGEEAEEIRFEPPHGFAAGKYEEMKQSIQEAIDAGELEAEDAPTPDDEHRPQDRIAFNSIRVELWKGSFDKTSMTYTFRLKKSVTANAAGDNADLCVDCQ